MYRYILSIVCCCFLQQALQAQQHLQIGLLPQLNLSYKLAKGWKLSHKLEARQVFIEGDFETACLGKFEYERTDFSTALAYKVRKVGSLSAGYMIRVQDKEWIHRISQQYTISLPSKHYLQFKHRFLLDETFSSGTRPSFRLRYRISTDLALRGKEIDAKELYLKLSNEYLGITDFEKMDIEIRAGLQLGYVFTEKHKMEWGLDYRLRRVVEIDHTHQFWFYLAYFASI